MRNGMFQRQQSMFIRSFGDVMPTFPKPVTAGVLQADVYLVLVKGDDQNNSCTDQKANVVQQKDESLPFQTMVDYLGKLEYRENIQSDALLRGYDVS